MSVIHCSSVLGEGAAVKAPTVWSAKMKQFFSLLSTSLRLPLLDTRGEHFRRNLALDSQL